MAFERFGTENRNASMNYERFSADDYAVDSFFIRWVKDSNAEADWFWQSFMKEHPEKIADIEEARKLVLRMSFRKDELSAEAFDSMRNRFVLSLQATIEQEKENVDDHTISETKNNHAFLWMKIAAAIAVPLVCIAMFIAWRNSSRRGDLPALTETFKGTDTEYRANPRGQKSVLQLSDGTKVWLNADSRLTYAKDFTGKGQRDVFLEGEAFFDVAHDEKHPFLVHTTGITIKVLGTAFNVKSYKDDASIETTLIRGKVSINKEGAGPTDGNVVLKPNQRAIFQKQTKSLNIEEVMAERLSSWRFDQLIFDETQISDVIVQLERWYDVKIHVQDGDSLQCRLTADLGKESLEEVLSLLSASQQITYTQTGKDVFITGMLCK